MTFGDSGGLYGASPRMRGTGGERSAAASVCRCIPAHAGNGSCVLRCWAISSVHPRACGERIMGEVLSQRERGASPRMRGTGNPQTRPASAGRCIPAHAGNGLPLVKNRSAWLVHPRACGERAFALADLAQVGGASPRMRGTEALPGRPLGVQRCIPAHAGNGTGPTACSASRTVHPRACGERGIGQTGANLPTGASPRMRGTGESGRARVFGGRCIPAHAGNGPCWAVLATPWTVHPRACGERRRAVSAWIRQGGASPRMRGTGRVRPESIAASRCIPAHAGNGSCVLLRRSDLAVHPRACGERGRTAQKDRDCAGASPRMRGTGSPPAPIRTRRRCIPAHAGNGPLTTQSARRGAVHLRACGERGQGTGDVLVRDGASPRMRGTAQAGLAEGRLPRCIPAHAGNGTSRARSPK